MIYIYIVDTSKSATTMVVIPLRSEPRSKIPQCHWSPNKARKTIPPEMCRSFPHKNLGKHRETTWLSCKLHICVKKMKDYWRVCDFQATSRNNGCVFPATARSSRIPIEEGG